ncbi:MAG: hypothetical protein ABI601_09660 [bacterium]
MRSLSYFRVGGRLMLVSILSIAATISASAQEARSGAPTVTKRSASSTTDSSFTASQKRGADARAMGVDQYVSQHRFDALPDGGRIELQRAVYDAAEVTTIRRHLREIATAFAAGDFTTPGFVHARQVPGTTVMAAKRGSITYVMKELPRGGEVRITTHDQTALAAVHEFIAFQRHDHRAGGTGTLGHTH